MRVTWQKSSCSFLYLSLQEKHLHCLAKKLLNPKSYLTANHPNLYVNRSTQALWWTHPNVFITLYELWMSKETSLQYGFCQCKVHHVQKKQAQNRQVYDDCNLHNANTVYTKIVTLPPQSLSRQQGPKELYMQSLWRACQSLVMSLDDLKPTNREKPLNYSLVLKRFGADRS